jgi:hypothetical protein
LGGWDVANVLVSDKNVREALLRVGLGDLVGDWDGDFIQQ